MNKIIIIFSLIFLSNSWTIAKSAENSPYIGIQGGGNWVSPQYLKQQDLRFVKMNFKKPIKSGYVFGVTAGWDSKSGLRPEIEMNYRKNSLNKFSERYYEGNTVIDGQGSESFLGVFTNIWYDFPVNLKVNDGVSIEPYLGGGVGYGRLTVKNLKAGGVPFGETFKDNVKAWQIGMGFKAKFNKDYSLSFDYRHLRTSQVDYHNNGLPLLPPDNIKTRYRSHSALVGIQYHF